LLAGLAGIVAPLFIPALALAHPLGNFTVNHYAGLRITPDGVHLDAVLDRAEIPTFQIRRTLDGDGDGELSPAELDGVRADGCAEYADGLALTADGTPLSLRLVAAGVTFPPGNGGLSTMRLVCEFEAPFTAALTSATTIAYRDTFVAERIGWREVTVQGDGTTIGGDLPTTTVSARLSAYPQELIGTPLDVREATITVSPGGPTLAPAPIPDAQPLPGVAAPSSSAAPVATPDPVAPNASPAPAADTTPAGAGIPGGVEGIPSILTTDRLDPVLIFVALLTAAALGAGHALTPGHGKTLMAAYLVGTRGTALHAAGLGLSVSVSHTLGILALAVVVLGAQQALPPDVVVRAAPVIAAITIVLIGGWMLVTELRRWRDRRVAAALLATPDHTHDHRHEHPHVPRHAHDQAHAHDGGHADDHVPDDGEHSHGGVRHRHVPAAGSTITWRSLFVLGLAGGLVPSTNALLILLGTIAAGRPAWGIVLVVAFGLGMAAVMGGVGLVFVSARGLLERLPRGRAAGRLTRLMPLGAAVLVLGLGLVLTGQAIGVRPVL
jgi:ABC-type nickel/cobalt efflux system permease component RcnA